MSKSINYHLSWVGDDSLLHSEILLPDNGELVIGRSPDADIMVMNSSVSRQHAKLAWEGSHLIVTDLNSSFGTWVDNVRLKKSEHKPIYSDAEIRLGNLILWYEIRNQDSEVELMQTCFHPRQRQEKPELSPEIAAFRVSLHRHMERVLDYDKYSQLVDIIDDELFELNSDQSEMLKEQRILHSISHLLNRSLTIPELSKNALDLVSKVLTADRGFVVLLDKDKQVFEPIVSRNFNQSSWSVSRTNPLSYSQTLVEKCCRQNEIMIIRDVLNNKSLSDIESIQDPGVRSVVIIPLQQDGRVVGVIYLDNINRSHSFESRQIPFLKTFAAHTSIALHNARLYITAITDDLTQLYCRNYIYERLGQEIQRAQRYDRPFSVLALDLDDFKKVNDKYGHNAGDQVLKMFSNILLEELRDSDIAGRFGGEEFIVILGETDFDGAILFAERIRLKTEKQTIEKDGQIIRVTTSIGVVNYHQCYGDMASQMLEEADKALYRAKDEGRNRVIGIKN